MRSTALTLLLLGAMAAPAALAAPTAVVTPTVTTVATPTPVAEPVAVPVAPPAASANVVVPPVVRAAPSAPAPPSRALIEKLGVGDRAWLSGDYRTALFAYQDGVYLDPTSAVARIRLARAYQALRHEDEARQQLTLALELDPDSAEARRLLDGLKAPPAAGAPQAGSPAPPASAPASGAVPKAYKLTEDDDASAPPPGARPLEPKAPEPVRPAPAPPR